MKSLDKLIERSQGVCELCSANEQLYSQIVVGRDDDEIDNQIAVCKKCKDAITSKDYSDKNHWRALTGSIWSEVPAVQAISYQILHELKSEDWAAEALESVYLDDSIVDWAMKEAHEAANKVVHKDAYGNILQTGDNVVLIENLNVKGTNYIAPKGTQVKKIRLVHDNVEQIEGKINTDTIVILTKFLKKA